MQPFYVHPSVNRDEVAIGEHAIPILFSSATIPLGKQPRLDLDD
jgi:hypothetical protein